METNDAVAIAAALWMVAAPAVLIRWVLRGRTLADDLDLGDPPLVERFDAYRRAEIRSLVATLVWLAVVGGAVLWVQLAAGATSGGIG